MRCPHTNLRAFLSQVTTAGQEKAGEVKRDTLGNINSGKQWLYTKGPFSLVLVFIASPFQSKYE